MSVLTPEENIVLTECAPDKLTIGASRLLVRWTVLMRPLLRSSPVEEIAIWVFAGGGVSLARFITVPWRVGGEALRFDISFR